MKHPTQNIMQRFYPNGLVLRGLLLYFLLTFLFSFGQEIDEAKALSIEKVYLHLDRSFYTAGEVILFKAYLMDARSHTSKTLSERVYVELIGPDSQIISQRSLKTNNSSAAGDFKLSQKSVAGTYTVRGYTNYMRNFGTSTFYTKEILVNTVNAPAVLSDEMANHSNTTLDVQFFPEGGYVINGFLNPIAFKALDSKGKGTKVLVS
jgi:hypothetical protein